MGRNTTRTKNSRNAQQRSKTSERQPSTSTRQSTRSANTKRQKNSRRQAISSSLSQALAAVPARFMVPRLLLIVAVVAMCGLGLVMVYSASSVSALKAGSSPSYYAVRQAIYILAGTVGAVLVAKSDYHMWLNKALSVSWIVILCLLVLTLILGMVSHGAQRWISIGPVSIQPSEFAKLVLVLTAANIIERYAVQREISTREAMKLSAIGVLLPLVLILIQPDKGTTFIIGATLVVMLILAGMPTRLIVAVAVVGALVLVVLILQDSYSVLRLVVWNPQSDRYGAGYQIIQGLYAFAKGGITGVGIGFSQQKYSYIPEAHNDYIFAIIGEELGLIGTVGVLIGFAVFVYAGIQIARFAPDVSGSLIVSGLTVMIAIQALVNVCGVTGMIPVSGKTLPFISYGGSSITSSLIVVGAIVSVSRSSVLPETKYDRQRSQMSVHTSAASDVSSTSRRGTQASSTLKCSVHDSSTSRRSVRGTLRVLEGGAQRSGRTNKKTAQRSGQTNKKTAQRSGRTNKNAAQAAQLQRRRINLGPSAVERLRSRNSEKRRP